MTAKLRFAALNCLIGGAALIAGCDFDIGGGTDGREGELEFSFSGNEFLECFLGCDVDRPIAVGAGSTLVILDDTPDKTFTVRVPDGVESSYQETFECQRVHADGSIDTEEDRTIQPHESCNEGEERIAVRTLTVKPSQPGPLLIEVLEDGELLDAVELEARSVAGAVILNGDDESVVDELALRSGDSVDISADLIDAEGVRLYFDELEHEWTVLDPSVAQVETFWLNFGGATAISFVADQPGTTTVRFEALGVSHEIDATVE